MRKLVTHTQKISHVPKFKKTCQKIRGTKAYSIIFHNEACNYIKIRVSRKT